jgi:probable blue pigment (indigoidine) exporter
MPCCLNCSPSLAPARSFTARPLNSKNLLPLTPAIAAGTALGISDVLAKLILATGCDVLTMLSFRSVVGLAFVATWLRFGPKPKADARVRWISMGVGIIFTGLIFCLFKAIEAIDVPTAILSYFTYPLLTGLIAALLGLETVSWRGVLCAVAAFCGLGIMIGAHPAGAIFAGVAFALGAAICRTAVLLVTRAYLVGADARLTTWYSVLSSMVVFVGLSFATKDLSLPQSTLGMTSLVGLSLATTAGILFVFMSTVRIGPFRTALIMHLEPLTAMILSAIVLGEVITPIQGLGSAVMLAALVAFQLWR